eukprot:SAG31_NODE_39883_length_284_cov_4.859459_1_plen_49_part_10
MLGQNVKLVTDGNPPDRHPWPATLPQCTTAAAMGGGGVGTLGGTQLTRE